MINIHSVRKWLTPIFLLIVIVQSLFILGQKKIQEDVILPMYSFVDMTYSNKKDKESRMNEMYLMKELRDDFKLDSKEWGFVTAEGTWMSDTELANNKSAVSIDCWKEWNNCIISQADLDDSFTVSPMLTIGSEYYEITKWDFDQIIAESTTTMGCFKYVLTMDRMNQVVSSVRTKVGDEGLCEGGNPKPLLIYLNDQFDNGLAK